jgi:HK97 family phage prohead protease
VDLSAIDWPALFAQLGLGDDEARALESKALGLRGTRARQFLGWNQVRYRNASDRLRARLAHRSAITLPSEPEPRYDSAKPHRWARLDCGRRVYELDRLGPAFLEIMKTEWPQAIDAKPFPYKRVFCPKVETLMREHKTFEQLQLKADETGVFTGMLSPYNATPDAYGDVISPTAYQKTLAESGGKIPLLMNHDVNRQLGLLAVRDTPTGLIATGRFNLDVPEARTAHSNLLFAIQHGLKTGLSIGFRAVKSTVREGVRHLTEIQLFEGSLTMFPAAPQALVSSAKSGDELLKAFWGPIIAALDELHRLEMGKLDQLIAMRRGSR